MIIDGRAIAEDLYHALSERRARSEKRPRLGIVVGAADTVIESFVRIKERAAARLDVELVRVDIEPEATSTSVIDRLHDLAARVDGIIVQLPLPAVLDSNAVLSEIARDKDIDAVNPVSENDHLVEAPVARAVQEILDRSHVSVAGKEAVVVGNGRLVGAPTSALLKRMGAHLTKVTETEGSFDDIKRADIVVSGVGSPLLIRPEHVKDGVVLIDAGTSEQGGKVHGDIDPACAEKASLFTPVPGGVGPIAVAMIFQNLFDLVEKRG